MSGFHVAIDGPAGSGKSTISKKVSQALGLIHIDTGAMYRAITYLALKKNISLDDKNAYSFVKNVKVSYKNDKILIENEDVTEEIRSDAVTKNVSLVSSFPVVRKYLVLIQRQAAKNNHIIMDGRDIGSVVLPEADLKIFLTANVQERAKRRMLELQAKGLDVDLNTMIDDIKTRDLKDSTRKESPLIIPKDAIIIDTTNYSVEDTVKVIINEILKKETYYAKVGKQFYNGEH